jgi:phosphoserine phosphatase
LRGTFYWVLTGVVNPLVIQPFTSGAEPVTVAHVETTVFVVRHGVTDWHRDRKVIGQRDVPLNAEGLAQARAVASALADCGVAEIVSSPLLRAVQTAEILGDKLGMAITRDPRLAEFRVGKWESMTYDEVTKTAEFQRFNANPLQEKLPGGEDLGEIRDRAVGAIDQALRDAPAGESLAVVTHAGIARIILAHYLGCDLARYHHLQLAPGSISALSFLDDRNPPRLRTLGWRASLKDLL